MNLLNTTNYKMFQLLEFNRSVTKTQKLEQSMMKYGFIPAYPLHVVKCGRWLKIKAGHHRFTVARKLGLPIYYVICDDDASIHELESATVSWSMQDYLDSFVRCGNPNYIAIQEYHERTGIALGLCASMLFGQSANSGNCNQSFKTGEYKVKDTTHAERVEDLVSLLKTCGIAWASDRALVISLSQIVLAKIIDIGRLKNKIRAHCFLIRKYATAEQYLDMWEDVYNRQHKGEKTPLTILVKQEAKKRSAVPHQG